MNKHGDNWGRSPELYDNDIRLKEMGERLRRIKSSRWRRWPYNFIRNVRYIIDVTANFIVWGFGIGLGIITVIALWQLLITK